MAVLTAFLLLCLSATAVTAAPTGAAPALPVSAEYVPVNADASADSSFQARYPYIIFIDEGEDADITDDFFYRYAASVVFKVSKYDLPTDDSTLAALRDSVLPRISRDSLKVVRVKMRGAASPEGPVRFNRFLSGKRQQALCDFVSERLQIPQGDSLIFETMTEDYTYLYRQMEQAGDPDFGRVKVLFDRYMPDGQYAELKRALQRIDGGRLWRRMLVTYYPSLRAARMVIVCQRKAVPEEPAEPIVPISPVIPADTVQVPDALPPHAHVAWQERVPRRELLSVKTNLLFYGIYMPWGYNRWCPIPNVAIEYYPLKGHFTYGASFDFPWWQNYKAHKYFQVRNYQLEARYYLRSGSISSNRPGLGAAYRGLYLQAYAHAVFFGICFDADRGWEGEGFGGGLGVGYVLPLTRSGHWRLEFQLQAGFIGGKHDPYQYEYIDVPGWSGYPHDDLYYYKYYGDPERFEKRLHRFTWFGPTRVGITLTYDLLYRRIQKKRASFRPWEKATIISELPAAEMR